jgi:hypothetical protein
MKRMHLNCQARATRSIRKIKGSTMAKELVTREELLKLPPDAMLNVDEVALLTRLSKASFNRYRLEGGGPVYSRPGKLRVLYMKGDVIAWLVGRRFRDIADERDQRQRAA